MMTERLYREDLRAARFRAHVTDAETAADGTLRLVLDRTAFFPGGGGQPADRGTLNGAPVVGFEVREDGAVVHLVHPRPARGPGPDDVHAAEGFTAGSYIEGEVDVARRLDLARQHTGQHLLSAAILHALGAETVSVHFGDDDSTLDVDRGPLSQAEIEAAEDEAARVVLEDRPVRASVHTPEEARGIGLRRPPPADQILAGEGLRVVAIDGYDLSACCGTHLARTGEIGLLRVLGQEKVRGRARLRFVAGERALRAAREAGRRLAEAAAAARAVPEGLAASIAKLAEERRLAEKRAEALEGRLAAALAEEWVRAGPLVARTLAPDDPRPEALATRIAALGGRAALAAPLADALVLVLARPESAPGADLGAAARAALGPLGAKGGGRPHFVRLSLPREVGAERALEAARALLAP
jgi:alanyl-tRNA synthetase